MSVPRRVGKWRPAAWLLLTLLALGIRGWDFGNPVIHVDEQYYLLVGDRMLHGAVPYLDIWDRKPIGLFLLYAGFRLLPGDGILAYQLAATVAAILTALVVVRAARRVGAAESGALGAGAAYLLGLSLLGGRGGQAPVFYDLPMAFAALLTLRMPDLARHRAIVANGALTCLLAGLAIQIKPTAAVESAFFGLAHLWCLRRAGARPVAIMAAGALWLAIGLAPTLAAGGWYAARGAAGFHAWWFATMLSIGLRPGYPAGQLAMRLLGIAAVLSPLIVAAAIGWRERPRGGAAAARMRLAHGWLAAATLGFLAIGTFFDHYALPLLAPLAIAAAPTLGRSARALVATLGLAVMLVVIERAVTPDDAAGARRVAAAVRANSFGRCPYVFIGDTITYRLADACLPTAYAFPNLLAYTTERGATGIDEAVEVRRIMAARPPVIVTSTRRMRIWNPASRAAVDATIARDYHLILSVPRSTWRTLVYVRNQR